MGARCTSLSLDTRGKPVSWVGALVRTSGSGFLARSDFFSVPLIAHLIAHLIESRPTKCAIKCAIKAETKWGITGATKCRTKCPIKCAIKCAIKAGSKWRNRPEQQRLWLARNPNGIESVSPGLAAEAYPGSCDVRTSATLKELDQ